MTDPDRDIRALLDDAVSDVEPRRGLDEITARTTPAPRRRSWAWGTAGAVVATAAVIAAVTAVTGLPGSTPSRPDPADGGVPDPTTSPWVVPVYYVGDTGAGPRLFREMHLGPPSRADDKDASAVQQAVDGDAFDPDYRSDWPAGTHVDAVRAGGGVTTVALSGGSLSAATRGGVRGRGPGLRAAARLHGPGERRGQRAGALRGRRVARRDAARRPDVR